MGMERVEEIFPAGGEGTLRGYYAADQSYLYAKTGTLSGVVALSGYLSSASGKPLIFSVLVNNHRASASEVRRAVERFLVEVRGKY
jgi:D-alanyl-D-alanine carboxypeptidase/D-alanyl-D-alanine-endopeptidase (penicillin-binding protein 4)